MMVLKTLLIAALLLVTYDPAYSFMLMGNRAKSTTNYVNDPNCQGAWYMNADGSTDETDRSGNGNTLTVSTDDTIPQSATVPSGYSGYSRDFEAGDGDYMYRADASLTGLDINGTDAKITIAAWVKFESAGVADYTYTIVGKSNATSTTYQYYLGASTDASKNISFTGGVSPDGTSPNATESVYTTLNTYTTGIWYHVAFVSDDTDLRIYVNGVLACTPINYSNGIFNADADFRVATLSTTWGGFDGLIDEVIVFDRALSESEILGLYTNGISGNKGGSD